MDKISKRVMLFIGNECSGTMNFLRIPIEGAAEQIGISPQSFLQCLSFLEGCGYVVKLRTSSGKSFGVALSHKGKNYRYFRRQQFLSYIADKWIDFLALITSIIAVIISLLALLKQ